MKLLLDMRAIWNISAQCCCELERLHCLSARSVPEFGAAGLLLNWKQNEQLQNFRKKRHKIECENNRPYYSSCLHFCLSVTYFAIFHPVTVFFFNVYGAVTLLIYHRLFHLKVEDLLSAETWRWGHSISVTATIVIVLGTNRKCLHGTSCCR